MYYNEFKKIERMRSILEKIAYFSVGLDFFVAIATLLVAKGFKYSTVMLMWGGYLLFAEVVLTGMLFGVLIWLKHYNRIINNIAMLAFRTRHSGTRINSAFGIIN
jgi:hypothetical protein